MGFRENFKAQFFHINESNFEDHCLGLFQYQARENKVYRQYLALLNINAAQVKSVADIPFLPIEFFKTHQVLSGNFQTEAIFESSGTTAQIRSKHYISDLHFYNKVSEAIFNHFYGPLKDYAFLALLPSYSERENSSLIYMMNHFISQSKHSQSGFYLDNYRELASQIANLKSQNIKIILVGVTFALLDFAENIKEEISGIIMMETGGMKGRRKEMLREEVHEILKQKFNLQTVDSEYGMTELLSQAYAQKDGEFKCPPWMKVILRSIDDPFEKGGNIKRGGINIIDLANIDSCAFIETKDIGEAISEGTFKVLGRFDNSEIRGCNLLIS